MSDIGDKKIKVSKNIQIKDLTKEELMEILKQKEKEILFLKGKIRRAKRALEEEIGLKEYVITEDDDK